MSKESAIRFLRELGTNEKAQKLLQSKEVPKSKDDIIKAYAEVATELGEELSPEDVAIALEECCGRTRTSCRVVLVGLLVRCV